MNRTQALWLIIGVPVWVALMIVLLHVFDLSPAVVLAGSIGGFAGLWGPMLARRFSKTHEPPKDRQ